MICHSSRPCAPACLLAALLAGLLTSTAAPAQDESLCTEPGLTLLADATADVDFQFLPAGLPLDPLDLEFLQVAQLPPAGDVTPLLFTLKVASLAQLVPRQAWFATFQSEDKRTYGVRMAVGEDGAVVFQSYLVLVDTDGNVTEGRYPETGSLKAAAADSSYSADGTIRIVVEAKNIGLRKPTGLLSGFNAGSLQQIPTGDTLTQSGDLLALIADGMPDDMARGGELAIDTAACPSTAKSAPRRFGGGALGAMGLLILSALAGLRRQLS